jgi:hypothetical protein
MWVYILFIILRATSSPDEAKWFPDNYNEPPERYYDTKARTQYWFAQKCSKSCLKYCSSLSAAANWNRFGLKHSLTLHSSKLSPEDDYTRTKECHTDITRAWIASVLRVSLKQRITLKWKTGIIHVRYLVVTATTRALKAEEVCFTETSEIFPTASEPKTNNKNCVPFITQKIHSVLWQ